MKKNVYTVARQAMAQAARTAPSVNINMEVVQTNVFTAVQQAQDQVVRIAHLRIMKNKYM